MPRNITVTFSDGTSHVYKNAPDECYERWRTTPDFEFIINKDTTFSLVEYQGCFTSNNPCVQYVGPMPP